MTSTGPLPPGPPLPALIQAALLWVAPLRVMRTFHRRYGDRLRLRVPGVGAIVYLVDPEDIKTVLRGDPTTYHCGEAATLLGEILGTRSLIVLDEEKHKRLRGMMLPAFHGESVRKQVAEMVDITVEDVANWPIGEPFPLLPRMRAITLEVILRTVIGVHDEDRLGRAAHRAATTGGNRLAPGTAAAAQRAAPVRALAAPRAAPGRRTPPAARRDRPLPPGPRVAAPHRCAGNADAQCRRRRRADAGRRTRRPVGDPAAGWARDHCHRAGLEPSSG